MTTYTAIPNGDIDQDSPITQPLMTAIRDNPIAISEGDATVPANLLPTVLLGTLTTTSGATQTLSSLVLTPYKALYITVRDVSFAASVASLSLNALVISGASVAQTDVLAGTIFVDLTNGLITACLGRNIVDGTIFGRNGTYSTATTSISFTGGTFDGGTILVYGVK